MSILSINYNAQGAITRKALNTNDTSLQKAIGRLSSGKKYNATNDGPASFSILEKMSTVLVASQQGLINGQNGTSLLDTADAGLANIERIFTDIGVLAEDASNGVWTPDQRLVFHTQAESLLEVANSITQSTNFLGAPILDGTMNTLTLQIGITNEDFDIVTIDMPNMLTGVLTNGMTTPNSTEPINLETPEDALTSITNIQEVLKTLRAERATIGSTQNSISAALSNRESMNNETQSTISNIGDADIAREMELYTNASAKVQASSYMFSIAMQAPNKLSQLIQSI